MPNNMDDIFVETLPFENLGDKIDISCKERHSIEVGQRLWSTSEHTQNGRVPERAPLNYRYYKKLELSYLNRRAALESLYWTSGSLTQTQYLNAMEELTKGFKLVQEHYQIEAVSLLIIDRKNGANPIDVKLFEDKYICNDYCKEVLGITLDQVYSEQLPEHLRGTKVFKQEWHTSIDSFVSNYPRLDNVIKQNEEESL